MSTNNNKSSTSTKTNNNTTTNLAAPAPVVGSATEFLQAARPVDAATTGLQPAPATEAAVAAPAPLVDPSKPYVLPPITATAATPNIADQSLTALRQQQLNSKQNIIRYEGPAAVIQGRVEKNFLQRCLPCIYDERDFVAFGEVKAWIVVVDNAAVLPKSQKGLSCWVYAAEETTTTLPLHQIDLQRVTPIVEDRNHPDPTSYTVSPEPNTNLSKPSLVTILLKDQQQQRETKFQICIDTAPDSTAAQRFLQAIEHNNNNKKTTTTKESAGPGAVAVGGTMNRLENNNKK